MARATDPVEHRQGTVTAIGPPILVRFDGDGADSQVLATDSYIASAGDRVVMGKWGTAWVIVGKVTTTGGSGSGAGGGGTGGGSGTTISYGAPVPSNPGDVNFGGISTAVNRSDHVHGREAHGLAQHPAGSVIPVANPTTSAPGDTTAEGSSTALARADHKHGREPAGGAASFATPGASAPGDTAAEGVAVTLPRSDHRHARENHGSAQHLAGTDIATATPGASAPGDTAAEGTATAVARADHRHSREAPGAGVTYAAPGSSAPGDTIAEGVAVTVARSDHRHGREAPGGGGGGGTSSAVVIVASIDAETAVRDAADYVCDGTGDQVEINAAILEATQLQARGGPTGGKARGTVQLTGGRFNINASIKMRTGVTLQGSGFLTDVRATGSVAFTDTGMIMMFDTNTHMTLVRDLWVNGNYSGGGAICSGFHYVGIAGGNSMNDDPASGNDPQNRIHGVTVYGFKNDADRHGMKFEADMRGTMVDFCYLREIGGNAIWFTASPDSFIQNVFIGGVLGRGIYIQGANVSVADSKVFYCDIWGVEVTSGYAKLSNVEAQDCLNGLRLAGTNLTATGIVADTIDNIGIEIAAQGVMLDGFQVAHRTGARYVDMNTGLVFTGSLANLIVVGRVDSAQILTKFTGTTNGAGNFIRVTGGGTLLAVG